MQHVASFHLPRTNDDYLYLFFKSFILMYSLNIQTHISLVIGNLYLVFLVMIIVILIMMMIVFIVTVKMGSLQ